MSAPNPRRREAEAFYSSLPTARLRELHQAFTLDKATPGVTPDDEAFCASRLRIIEAILLTRLD